MKALDTFSIALVECASLRRAIEAVYAPCHHAMVIGRNARFLDRVRFHPPCGVSAMRCGTLLLELGTCPLNSAAREAPTLLGVPQFGAGYSHH
eukprot:3678474-Amphidinium_carterae.2